MFLFWCVAMSTVDYTCLYGLGDHRDRHVCAHSFPTRRSSVVETAAARDGSFGMAGILRSCRAESSRHVGAAALPCRTMIRYCGGEGAIGGAHVRTPVLMRISYAHFCLKKKKVLTTRLQRSQNNTELHPHWSNIHNRGHQ